MLATSAEAPLSCTRNVPYVQSVPTAAIVNESSLFIVKEEDSMDYLCDTAPAHTPHASPTNHHIASHSRESFSFSLTDLQ